MTGHPVPEERPTDGPPAAAAAQPEVAAVAEAAALLDGIDVRPVAERVAVLDDVHRRLQDALASLDDA